jgi:hypothetical protein
LPGEPGGSPGHSRRGSVGDTLVSPTGASRRRGTLMAGNDRLRRVHEQPQPTEEEQEQAPERVADEEPERDERSADDETGEPVHEA